MVGKTLLILLGLGVAFALYVRLAPSASARWHVDVNPVPKRYKSGVVEVIAADATTLSKLGDIAGATPRTKLLAGDVAQGHVTFVTRSALWGFPDYTTMQLTNGGKLTIYGRLRFGRSDLGVNQARIAGWLQRLQPVE